KIARMQSRAYAARSAYYTAAQRIVAGLPYKTEAAIAKLIGSEAAMDNARDATQIFGGYGFMNETLVARHYRDSKILEIGEGTTEVQLMLIARSLEFYEYHDSHLKNHPAARIILCRNRGWCYLPARPR